MDNLRDQQQRIAVLKQVASQLQNQPRPVSGPPVANMPLPPYPRRRPSDKGSKNQVQAENANAPRKSSDSETDRLQDIQEEPRRRIGPSRVKELAKFFTPTSDEEENSRVNNRTIKDHGIFLTIVSLHAGKASSFMEKGGCRGITRIH